MAEYTTISDGEALTLQNGSYFFRVRSNSNKLKFEQRRSGQWLVIDDSAIGSGSDGTTFRIGERSGYFVVDQCYSPEILGFSGVEGFDWDNISQHQL